MGTKGKHLGEFEEMVLLAVGVLGNEAYGISVKNKIEELTERSVSMGLYMQPLTGWKKRISSSLN